MEKNSYFEALFNQWQASDLPIDEFLAESKKQTVRNILNGMPPYQGGFGQGLGGQTTSAPPKWNNIEEMNRYIKAHPPKARPKPKSPEVRRAEIERELDIIRGRIPTPKGFKVDAGKVKRLMTELRQLNEK